MEKTKLKNKGWGDMTYECSNCGKQHSEAISCPDLPPPNMIRCPRTVSGRHLWGTGEFETSYGMPKCKYCDLVWDLEGEPK